MRIALFALASVLPYALGFGGSHASNAAEQEPVVGSSADVSVKSATPSGCGKHLSCWECESNSCNWYSNGCSTATSSPSTAKCNTANPSSVTPCTQKYDCKNCTYQQGCIWYNNQCKYSESGDCQNDPTCANTSSQCPVNDPCSGITDCGGCAITNGCAWSTVYNKCQGSCTQGCVYVTGQCPYSYCDNYTNSGCSNCTQQTGCIFVENRCIQSSKSCDWSTCFNYPSQCQQSSGCGAVGDCATCTRTQSQSSGGKCQWQQGQCKDYCDSFSTCTTQDYQC